MSNHRLLTVEVRTIYRLLCFDPSIMTLNNLTDRDLVEEIIVKTLILNGSPRKNGDTVSLIEKITEKIV